MVTGGTAEDSDPDAAWATLHLDPEAVAESRHHIRQTAEAVLGYGENAKDVELAFSEVLTNALQHGAGDTADVRIVAGDSSVQVEVRSRMRECSPTPHIPDEPLDDYGRGLLLVQAFTDWWDWTTSEDGTVTVWFRKNRWTRDSADAPAGADPS